MEPVALIPLPPALRDGIERRQPRGGRFKDQAGQRFDGYEVLGFAGYMVRYAAWLCRCHCGKRFVRRGTQLGRKGTYGCGCGIQAKSNQPAYIRAAWRSIIARCDNPQHSTYHLYGKCGVGVCKRWRESIDKFAADMGPRPAGQHVVCRRDVSKGFTPSNCYWGSRDGVRFRHERFITHNGQTLGLSDWARVLGISREAMRMRADRCIENGWDPSWAVVAPITPRVPMKEPAR